MKIKNMSKRAISVFLSLMMCVSLLQVPAFAATEPQYDEFGNLITTESAAPVESETPVVTEPVVPETPVVPEDDAVVDNNSDVDVETDADTESDADVGTDADTENDADVETDVDAEDGADAEDDADTESDADAEDEANPETGADAEDEANTETNADAEDQANTESDTNVEDQADVDTDADTKSDVEDPNATEAALFSTCEPLPTGFKALKSAIESATNGGTISVKQYLDANSTEIKADETITIEETANVILDLCGCTINGLNAGQGTTLFNVKGTLTIQDSTDNGSIKAASENVINNSGTLNIEGGTISATNSGSENRAIFSTGIVNMNGGTITGGNAGNGGGVFVFGDNGVFNMNGGSITGNKATNGGGVYADNGATFTMSGEANISDNSATKGGAVSVGTRGTSSFVMNGGTVENNTADDGGGIYVGAPANTNPNTPDRGGSFTMNDGTVNGNSAQNGGGVYVNGGEFTMDGGLIGGSKDENGNKANVGGGVYVNGGKFEMSNGSISYNNAGKSTQRSIANKGGGVFVAPNGTFNLSGNSSIDHNIAGEGGGVYVENLYKVGKGDFTMTGGSVDSNAAMVGEGGGLYFNGDGKITKGSITNNVTFTKNDLGGGGIYVEVNGTLNIVNALVYDNFANGLGGGLAACVHGRTSAVRLDGAAIFGNESKGAENGKTTDTPKVDGYKLWENREDFKAAAQDIFTASDRAQDGKDAGAIIGNMMVGGGQSDWTGWNVTNSTSDSTENPYTCTWSEIQNGETPPYVHSDRLLALTSNATEEAREAALSVGNESGVIIAGNRSEVTHGGGIANNGILTFGENGSTNQYEKFPTLTVKKTVSGDADSLKDWEFTFDLEGTNGGSTSGTATKDDAETTLSLNLDMFDPTKVEWDENGTCDYTFTVKENPDGTLDEVTPNGTMTFDDCQYKITVTVTKTDTEESVGYNKYTISSFSFANPVIEKLDKDGNVIQDFESDGILSFVNTYEKPEEPILPTPLVAYDPLELTIKKVFSVVGGEAPTEGEFNFKAEGEEFNANASISLKELHENDNTADTTLTAGVKFDDDGKMMGYDFTVSELDEEMANVTYSKHSYHVSLKVDQKSDDDGITHYFYVPTITHYDENGNVVNDDVATDIANNILTFTNVFKPTTPPTDTDSENPGPDPEEPTTPPTTPDRPSRPTPPPTPEEPTIDIPDDDVPLAPAPEEPEVSIPDEDVPLAGEPPLVELPEPEVPLAPMPPETTTIPDPEVPLAGVPQTGDNAGGFYALMALAACGLVVLNLRKKENEI